MANNTNKPVRHGVAKVPVIMQLEALECGAASLAMIMAYYGKWVPLEQVRLDCAVSRDGSSAVNILKAARRYGMSADGYHIELEALRENVVCPCILHWNFDHFVVLDGFSGNKAVLNDPARGHIKISMEELDECFTGVCLMFEPTDQFVRDGKQKSVLAFAKKRLTGVGSAVAFVMLLTILASLFGIITPGFTRFFMDRILTGENRDLLLPFLVLFAGFGFVQVLVMAVQSIYSLKISGKMAMIGNSTYMWQILRMPVEFFSQRMAGDLLQRQSSNAMIAQTLVNTLAPLALNAVMMVVYLVIMLRYSVLLTLIGVVTIVLNLILSRIISAKRVNITRVQLRDAGQLQAFAVSGIQMIETIKSSGAEDGFFQKWAGYQASVNAQTVSYSRLNVFLGSIPAFLASVASYSVLVLGVWLTMQGKFSYGSIMLFQSLLNQFMMPAQTLISAGQTLQEMRTDMERIEDVMNYPVDPYTETTTMKDDLEYRKLTGKVELRNVTFGYSKLSPPLIENFSMVLEPGSRVAFVGPSGCGKSTLSRLISGLYKPWSGEVLFDGKPVSEIERSVFTGSVAVVDQDIIMFEDTISNNIRMWDKTIEDFEVILAARDAQIHNDIMTREGGYRGRLLEGGKDLSGGQRQRLEIARVLSQDPSVIILDEATSALDARTEYELVKAVKDRGITNIVIAHRLSTIRDCDEIIVLDHGKVVERGKHAELYAKGGFYADLIANE